MPVLLQNFPMEIKGSKGTGKDQQGVSADRIVSVLD
jgi:hypothetical protein